MNEEKTYTVQVTLEDREHQLLKQAQKRRHLHGLPRLSLEKLIKMYMLDGMLQGAFSQQKEGVH